MPHSTTGLFYIETHTLLTKFIKVIINLLNIHSLLNEILKFFPFYVDSIYKLDLKLTESPRTCTKIKCSHCCTVGVTAIPLLDCYCCCYFTISQCSDAGDECILMRAEFVPYIARRRNINCQMIVTVSHSRHILSMMSCNY